MCLCNLLGKHEADAGSAWFRCIERYKEVSGVRQSRPVVEYRDDDLTAYALPPYLYLRSAFA